MEATMCTGLEQQLGSIRQGEHLCLVYDNVAEQMAAAVTFLRAGLGQGERCVYIADERTTEEVALALAAGGVNVSGECARGALVLLTRRETYLRAGRFDSRRMIEFLGEAVEEALAAGFAGLRATGEMTWALSPDVSKVSLIEYEAELNDFFPKQRALGLCQYSRSRFPPAVIRDVLRTHPVAVLGCQVCRNLYYEPPQMVLGQPPAADQLDWMMAQLRQGHAIEQSLQEANARLGEANHRKDQFLAMLAHELRNPLAPLWNALHVMRLAGDRGPAIEQARAVAERQVQHLARLVDDLLDVSRIAHGKIELRKEQIELTPVVASAVEAARPLVEARRHDLSVSLPTKPVRLEADPTRLGQILVNLLTNAAKYTEPGGRIGLTAERDGDELVVRVRDNGVGIAPDMLARVFEPFVQLERSQDSSQGGLGIGLALVRSLVDLHGGSIIAASLGPGQGSEFILRLPALPEARAEWGAVVFKAGQPSEGRALRVLVVDDNVDAAQSLAVLLNLWGHEVCTAHDGTTALQAAQTWRPEVVLLDIGLPGMDGHEVARRLRDLLGPDRPLLIALTGHAREDDRRRSQDAGFDRHLVKPVDPEILEVLLAQSEWLGRETIGEAARISSEAAA
jgi:signal transduction histidine kinase/ActR/RegA family two-component response regulator